LSYRGMLNSRASLRAKHDFHYISKGLHQLLMNPEARRCNAIYHLLMRITPPCSSRVAFSVHLLME